jgi:uncharacterized phosphosugar-binding protein
MERLMMSAEKLFTSVGEISHQVESTQMGKIQLAATMAADAIAADRFAVMFGTGHSFMPIMDTFPRVGCFPGWLPIYELASTVVPMLSGNQGLRQVLFIEKAEGYGSVVLENYHLIPADVMFVISNSGTNTAGVEVALGAQERGLKVVAVTSVAHSQGSMSRHSSGKRLYEVADVVIDTCVPAGDAQVEIPGWAAKVGAVSTIIGMTIMQSVASETASILAGRGITLPVYPSHTSGQNGAEIAALEDEEERLMVEQSRRMAGMYR